MLLLSLGFRRFYANPNRLALNGAFTLYYFVGPAPVADTDELYSIYPTLAGASHIFAAPEEVCDNCGNQAAASQADLQHGTYLRHLEGLRQRWRFS